MPRTARDQSATGIYHVMIRGINRQDIFEALALGGMTIWAWLTFMYA